MSVSRTISQAEGLEAEFGFDELFFSRTNSAGIIKYGNSVFQRISGYEWNELLEKPHKIIRHADTPRAVFWLLWSTIKRGEPIGAYVKNRTKDGRSYWVFAIVTAVPDGFLSVRLRPSSEIFNAVRQEYAALVEAENREPLTPEASAQRLLARLQALGFDSYREFMAKAVNAELASRDQQLSRTENAAVRRFSQLGEAAKSLIANASHISKAYKENEEIPLNFRVLASHLGQEGAAIAIISSNYAMLAADMKANLTSFTEAAKGLADTLQTGTFLVATARLQRELMEFFEVEANSCPLDRAPETRLLDAQQQAYRDQAVASLRSIARQVEGFQQACADMNRIAAGLDVTRVIGKVESTRHVDAQAQLGKLLLDLETFQSTVAGALRELGRTNHTIRAEALALIAAA